MYCGQMKKLVARHLSYKLAILFSPPFFPQCNVLKAVLFPTVVPKMSFQVLTVEAVFIKKFNLHSSVQSFVPINDLHKCMNHGNPCY